MDIKSWKKFPFFFKMWDIKESKIENESKIQWYYYRSNTLTIISWKNEVMAGFLHRLKDWKRKWSPVSMPVTDGESHHRGPGGIMSQDEAPSMQWERVKMAALHPGQWWNSG